jgi:hypothetical protein
LAAAAAMGRLTEEQAAREAGSAGTNATSLKLTHRALSFVLLLLCGGWW